ncbi:MAG TPA: hypothetical protein VHZ74_22705 [Bryobacteraceae bacterium]|jgi:hypothetical protein|nr:hypothetical protein [Bryobacteraceae bacterium]
MANRRSVLAGLLGLGGLRAVAKAAPPREEAVFNSGLELFFAMRDTVINFNGNNGLGNQLGTVEGVITGTSITNFQFIPTSQTTIKYDNRCVVSDVDGDSIIFDVNGTGSFLAPPPSDPSNPLGNLIALGGPLRATYTVLIGTGKYAFLVGRKFPAKMMAVNAVQNSNGVLGQVYCEVYSDQVGIVASMIKAGTPQ